ncbi:DUF6783 domain-containing protein [Blautia producta]|uniref:DUF6783 domain-containing protein n=1 Tax=Blautia producta TaxID=33035 RepID=UPI0036F1EBF0
MFSNLFRQSAHPSCGKFDSIWSTQPATHPLIRTKSPTKCDAQLIESNNKLYYCSSVYLLFLFFIFFTFVIFLIKHLA